MIRDLSVPLGEGFPVWPGDPPVVLERFLVRGRDGAANASRLCCSVHAGTHVDAPLHVVDGACGADALDLSKLVGRAHVVDLRGRERIEAGDLDAANLPGDASRLLLRTDNSRLWVRTEHPFMESFVALTASAADWIVERGIELVGIDYHSVQPYSDASPYVHERLLGAGVVVVETLDLRDVEPGSYLLVCLPLKLMGSDGAPARAVLLDDLPE